MKNKFKNKSGAVFVAAGIFISRLAGLMRESIFAHYFGNSAMADVFRAAQRIPNFLQNLFGEGSLSASFIPVYSSLLKENEEEARAVAHTIFTILCLLVFLTVAIGVTFASLFIDLIVPGFEGEKRQISIDLVKIMFVGTGILVLSAWCLGVQNSHRHFFLSYFAPVLWNASIIAGLVFFGSSHSQKDLAYLTAWSLVVGCLLQFLVQIPTTLHLLKSIKFRFLFKDPHVQTVTRNFLPAVLSRGIVQISAYVDSMFASFLGHGALANLSFAQTLYLLPVSLFGMSVAASELPTMSEGQQGRSMHEHLSDRLTQSLNRVAFYIVPSAFAFLALGDAVVSLVYESGQFTARDTQIVWLILVGYGIGLITNVQSRLFSTVFFALKDTKTTLYTSILRVMISTGLGAFFCFYLFIQIDLSTEQKTFGLALASSIGGFIEWTLLKIFLKRRNVTIHRRSPYILQIGAAALAGVASGWTVRWLMMAHVPKLIVNFSMLFTFGFVYLAFTHYFEIQETRALFSKIKSRLKY